MLFLESVASCMKIFSKIGKNIQKPIEKSQKIVYNIGQYTQFIFVNFTFER